MSSLLEENLRYTYLFFLEYSNSSKRRSSKHKYTLKEKRKEGKIHLNNILESRDKYSSLVQPYHKLKFLFVRHSNTIAMFA